MTRTNVARKVSQVFIEIENLLLVIPALIDSVTTYFTRPGRRRDRLVPQVAICSMIQSGFRRDRVDAQRTVQNNSSNIASL